MERGTMDIHKPSMGEGAARFWTAVFGGVTAIGLVAAGIYTLREERRAPISQQLRVAGEVDNVRMATIRTFLQKTRCASGWPESWNGCE